MNYLNWLNANLALKLLKIFTTFKTGRYFHLKSAAVHITESFFVNFYVYDKNLLYMRPEFAATFWNSRRPVQKDMNVTNFNSIKVDNMISKTILLKGNKRFSLRYSIL